MNRGINDKGAEELVEPLDPRPLDSTAGGGSGAGGDGYEGPEDEGPLPYEPTREELLLLARHWYRRFVDIRVFEFFNATTGSSERHGKQEANYNLERLAQALGTEAVETVVGEVEEEARWSIGEEDWRAFTRGTPEERERLQDETQAAREYLDRKRRDRLTRRRAFACLRRDPWGIYRDADGDLWSWGQLHGGRCQRKRPRLLLAVTTRQGWRRFVPGCSLKRPPGWRPPFGLGSFAPMPARV